METPEKGNYKRYMKGNGRIEGAYSIIGQQPCVDGRG